METSLYTNESHAIVGDKVASTNGKNHTEEMLRKTKECGRKKLIDEIETLIKQENEVDDYFQKRVDHLIRNYNSIIGTNGITYSILGESIVVEVKKGVKLFRMVQHPTYIGLPPLDTYTYGRLNLPSEHPFYLSFSPYSALNERKDYRNILVFRTIKTIKCSLARANLFQGKQFVNKDRMIGRNLSSLYNSLFNIEGVNDRAYYVTNYIKNNFLDNQSCDAVLYPSKSLKDTNESIVTRTKNRASINKRANFLLKDGRNPYDFLELEHDYNIKIINDEIKIIADNKNGVI